MYKFTCYKLHEAISDYKVKADIINENITITVLLLVSAEFFVNGINSTKF